MPESIEERLKGLRNISMSMEREREITRVLQREIDIYRRNKRTRLSSRWISRVASISAAVIAIVAIGALLIRPPLIRHHQTSSTLRVQLNSLHYSTQQINQIKTVAQTVGVTPRIPRKGLSNDKLTMVKNGGKDTLILDYVNFWVVESTTPISPPTMTTTKREIFIGKDVTGTFITNKNSQESNSFLYFKAGSTYLLLENLNAPLSMAQSQAIASTFTNVQ